MADRIKEFLVALGWHVDEHGMHRFETAIARSSKSAAELGLVVAGTAIAVEAGIERIARQYENLYYASQRTGATASNLDALRYAAAQVGLTADQMQGAVENFARSVRLSPGLESFLDSQGIKTKGRETSQVFLDFIDRMRELHPAVAARIAQMFGIDPDTLLMLEKGIDELKKREQDRLDVMHKYGIDVDKQDKQFVGFMRTVRDMESHWEGVARIIAKDLLPVAQALLGWANVAADKFVQIDNVWHGWLGTLTGIGAAAVGVMGLARALRVVTGIGTGTGAFALLGKLSRFAPLALTGAAGSDQKLGDAPHGGSIDEFNKQQDEARASGGAPLYSLWQWLKGQATGGGQQGSAMEYFQGQGWSAEQSAGIAANLNAESWMNPWASGDGGKAFGLAQWHSDRQDNFKRWSGHDIRDSTMQEQLAFVQYELTQGSEKAAGAALRRARTAEEAGRTVSTMYERPADAFGEAQRRALGAAELFNKRANVTIQQTNHFQNHGADAQDTARLVHEGMDRTNGDLVRNLRGAIDAGAP